jgi:hypothetical protein
MPILQMPHHVADGHRYPLIAASVVPNTSANYRRAVHLFLEWVFTTYGSLTVLHTTPALDLALCEYLHWIWRTTGKGKQLAKNTVYGCVHFLPRLRGRLQYSLVSLRGLERLQPSVPHRPMSYANASVVAVAMASQGLVSSAIGTLLAFDCYLRVSEMTNLVREDVAMPNDPRLGVDGFYNRMALRIGKTKKGINLWVTVRSPVVQHLVLILLRSVPAGGKVFPLQLRYLPSQVSEDLSCAWSSRL